MNGESQETWEYTHGVPRNMEYEQGVPTKHVNKNRESQEIWNIKWSPKKHGNMNIKSQETWKYEQTVPRKMGIYTWSPKKHGI